MRQPPLISVSDSTIDIRTAAEQYPCSVASLLKYVKKKKLKGQKINGRWYIDTQDFHRARSTRLIQHPARGGVESEGGETRTVMLQLPADDLILVEQLLRIKNQKLEDILTHAFFAQRDSLRGIIEPALRRPAA